MRQTSPPHSQLLTRAARSILRPLGLTQKGRSRIWLDDHGWWVCVVEFQPSGFSRGSYLNVGCMWLWRAKDYISFDEGSRVESFSQFQNESQFQPETERLAARAADEVIRYRELFPDLAAVANYYVGKSPDGFWPSFHAAVACAAAGRREDAKRFFRNVTENTDDRRDWVVAAQDEARQLNSIAGQRDVFQKSIIERVHAARNLQKLPPISLVDLA